jgi:PhzF family phenazine biosynthesis protein
MKLKLYQVDAFGQGVFTGNPAAVVPLTRWLTDDVLAAIAEENNLAETAFIVRADGHWDLRWFTPKIEVALCGHATLAAAHVICEFIDPGALSVRFQTRQSGVLTVTKLADSYELSLPAIAATEQETPETLVDAIGARPDCTMLGRYSDTEWDYMAVFDSQTEVQDLNPDMGALAELESRGVICTAPGDEVDFVSRYFAPAAGVPEDHVTGSAHCILTPYWARRLAKTELQARQISGRGGWLQCTSDQGIVRLKGRAATYLEGSIFLK